MIVFLFFGGHQHGDDFSNQLSLTLKAFYFSQVGIFKMGSTEVETGSFGHFVNDSLNQALLF
jgi:hypothetical protein